LHKLHGAGVPVVAVFLSGRPLWVNPEINASDAFVAAWLPGTEGGGIADVLFKTPDGRVHYDFHGKLSFSWPRTPGQTQAIPVASAANSPLFPLGYGLRYHDDGELKKLPEDVDSASAAIVDTHVFFAAGRPGTGWHWVAGEGVAMSATDKSAQEDARLLSWKAAAAAQASLTLTGSSPVDLQREANGQLSLGFDYRVSSPLTAPVSLSVECGAGCSGSLPIQSALSTVATGQWGHLKVPLACFATAGANLSRITAPFVVQTAGHTALSVANIRLESGADGTIACSGGH
jgi:beta-glucosidase